MRTMCPRGDAFHHELVLPDESPSGIALLLVGWATPPRNAVIREPPVLELLADKEADRWGLPLRSFLCLWARPGIDVWSKLTTSSGSSSGGRWHCGARSVKAP